MHRLDGSSQGCGIGRSELIAAFEGKVRIRGRRSHCLETRYAGLNVGTALVACCRRGDGDQERGEAGGHLLLEILCELIVRGSGESNDGACLGSGWTAQDAINGSLGSLAENIEEGHIDGRLGILWNHG